MSQTLASPTEKISKEGLIVLNTVYQLSRASEKMGKLNVDMTSRKNYVAQKELIGLMREASKKPEICSARAYCMNAGAVAVEERENETCVNIVKWWIPGDQMDFDFFYEDPDPSSRHFFDEDAPAIWKIAPNEDDEAQAKEAPPLEPTSVTEKRAWEVSKKFDENTKGFGQWWIKTFCNDGLFTLLESSIDESYDLFDEFIRQRARDNTLGSKIYTDAQRECDQTFIFFNAYNSAVGNQVFDDVSYEDFKRIFVERTGPLVMLFKNWILGARKNPQFVKLEDEKRRVAPAELRHYPKLRECHDLLRTSMADTDLLEVTRVFGSMKGVIREGAYVKMLTDLYPPMLQRLDELMSTTDTTNSELKHDFLCAVFETMMVLPHRQRRGNGSTLLADEDKDDSIHSGSVRESR